MSKLKETLGRIFAFLTFYVPQSSRISQRGCKYLSSKVSFKECAQYIWIISETLLVKTPLPLADSAHTFDQAMPYLKTKTTFLEMYEPPEVEIAAPRDGVSINKTLNPSLDFYLSLYRGVGSQLHWVDRLVMKPDEVWAIIQHELVDILVLWAKEEPLGYAELDRRQAGEIELAYFGLFPQAIGRGLGKYLLNHALRVAWLYHPEKVCVHTCDLDHPAALPTYLNAGFVVCGVMEMEQWIPE